MPCVRAYVQVLVCFWHEHRVQHSAVTQHLVRATRVWVIIVKGGEGPAMYTPYEPQQSVNAFLRSLFGAEAGELTRACCFRPTAGAAAAGAPAGMARSFRV